MKVPVLLAPSFPCMVLGVSDTKRKEKENFISHNKLFKTCKLL